MENINQLELQDSITIPNDEDKVSETIQDGTEIVQQAKEYRYFNNIDQSILGGASGHSNDKSNDNLRIELGGTIPAEEPSSDSSTQSNKKGVEPFDDKFPKGSKITHFVDQWRDNGEERVCFKRYERRDKQTRYATDCSTHPGQLFIGSQFQCNGKDEKLFFHATSWLWAKNILETHPRIGNKPGDLAPNGAFYLNPDYSNCYEWFSAKNGVFQGEHAMLIFKFDPWSLDRKGDILSEDEWKRRLQNLNRNNCKLSWLIAPQNSDPANFQNQGNNPRRNLTSEGDIAWQLVIRSQKMCLKLSEYLVGCIFYEKIDARTQ